MIFVNPKFTELESLRNEREIRVAVMDGHVALAKGYDHLHHELFRTLEEQFGGDRAASYTIRKHGDTIEIIPFSDFGPSPAKGYRGTPAEEIINDLMVWMEH